MPDCLRWYGCMLTAILLGGCGGTLVEVRERGEGAVATSLPAEAVRGPDSRVWCPQWTDADAGLAVATELALRGTREDGMSAHRHALAVLAGWPSGPSAPAARRLAAWSALATWEATVPAHRLSANARALQAAESHFRVLAGQTGPTASEAQAMLALLDAGLARIDLLHRFIPLAIAGWRQAMGAPVTADAPALSRLAADLGAVDAGAALQAVWGGR
jgi:hypothetical protein